MTVYTAFETAEARGTGNILYRGLFCCVQWSKEGLVK